MIHTGACSLYVIRFRFVCFQLSGLLVPGHRFGQKRKNLGRSRLDVHIQRLGESDGVGAPTPSPTFSVVYIETRPVAASCTGIQPMCAAVWTVSPAGLILLVRHQFQRQLAGHSLPLRVAVRPASF